MGKAKLDRRSNASRDVGGNCIDIYRRIMKYPPCMPRRADGPMKIVHNLSNGGWVANTAPEAVTADDLEKMFVVMKQGVAVSSNEDAVKVKCSTSEIKKMCNCKDSEYISKALKRIAGMLITYYKPDGKILAFMHLINSASFDAESGEMVVHFNREFWDVCRDLALTLNVEAYIKMSPTAKTLYMFLASNSGYRFAAELVAERMVLSAKSMDKQVQTIKAAMAELVEQGHFAGGEIVRRDGRRELEIKRKVPQQVDLVPQRVDLQQANCPEPLESKGETGSGLTGA